MENLTISRHRKYRLVRIPGGIQFQVKSMGKWTIIDHARSTDESGVRRIVRKWNNSVPAYRLINIVTMKKNPNVKEALEAMKKVHADQKAGHTDAVEFWKGYAAGALVSNPKSDTKREREFRQKMKTNSFLKKAHEAARAGDRHATQLWINRAANIGNVSDQEVYLLDNILMSKNRNPKTIRIGKNNPLYRVFTEAINQGHIEQIVNQYYPGYTLMKGRGYWKGEPEDSLLIEILTEGHEDSKVKELAERIRRDNRQESVLVEKLDEKSWFVGG